MLKYRLFLILSSVLIETITGCDSTTSQPNPSIATPGGAASSNPQPLPSATPIARPPAHPPCQTVQHFSKPVGEIGEIREGLVIVNRQGASCLAKKGDALMSDDEIRLSQHGTAFVICQNSSDPIGLDAGLSLKLGNICPIAGPDSSNTLFETSQLRPGSSGPEVEKLQELLKSNGFYDGDITGHYGRKTARAVAKFQSDNGIAVDGVVGSQTLEALRQYDQPVASGPIYSPGVYQYCDYNSCEQITLRRGDEGEYVRQLQLLLKEAGYYDGLVNGKYGPRTESAVRNFQRTNRLLPDGVAGPDTFDALRSYSSIAP